VLGSKLKRSLIAGQERALVLYKKTHIVKEIENKAKNVSATSKHASGKTKTKSKWE
jgi:hypothetical protein